MVQAIIPRGERRGYIVGRASSIARNNCRKVITVKSQKEIVKCLNEKYCLDQKDLHTPILHGQFLSIKKYFLPIKM